MGDKFKFSWIERLARYVRIKFTYDENNIDQRIRGPFWANVDFPREDKPMSLI